MKKEKWMIGATALALSIGLAACSSGETEKASVEEKEKATEEKPHKEIELKKDAKFDSEKDKASHNITTKKLGETIKVDDLNVTVSSPKVIPDSDMTKSKNGQFVSFDITVENTGKEEHSISELANFIMEKGDTQYFSTIVAGATENHLNGKIPAGETQKGIATFDVPKEGDLSFTFSGFTKSKGVWTVPQTDIQPAQ